MFLILLMGKFSHMFLWFLIVGRFFLPDEIYLKTNYTKKRRVYNFELRYAIRRDKSYFALSKKEMDNLVVRHDRISHLFIQLKAIHNWLYTYAERNRKGEDWRESRSILFYSRNIREPVNDLLTQLLLPPIKNKKYSPFPLRSCRVGKKSTQSDSFFKYNQPNEYHRVSELLDNNRIVFFNFLLKLL